MGTVQSPLIRIWSRGSDNIIAAGQVGVDNLLKFQVQVRQYADKETGELKRFLTFPQKMVQDQNGATKYVDICYPSTAELRFAIQEAVFRQVEELEAFREKPVEITGIQMYQSDQKNIQAYCNVTFDNFVVKGIRLMKTEEGNTFLAMPSYQAKDGKWIEHVSFMNNSQKNKLLDFCKEAYLYRTLNGFSLDGRKEGIERPPVRNQNCFVKADMWLDEKNEQIAAQGTVSVNEVMKFHCIVWNGKDKATGETVHRVSFPQRIVIGKDGSKNYMDICFSISTEMRKAIIDTVLAQTEKMILLKDRRPSVTKVTVYPVKEEGALKAYCNLMVDDIAIRGVRLMEGNKGAFVAMPAVKGNHDNWIEQVIIRQPDIRKSITEACNKEFSRQEKVNGQTVPESRTPKSDQSQYAAPCQVD